MEFISYFGAVFTPFSFLILIIGTGGGLILGATPGLSPTMAVALLIPFTFQMEPAQGLILLGAAYTSSVAGGAISAILLRIPGAPANIATALDGYAMAQKGEATKALQMCFVSSAMGGVVGILVLIFLTPVLAAWALGFGPSHLFWVAILGVTVIATLDSKSVVNGLLSGCIGLWISTIGLDSIQGVERFIFSEHLDGGVHVIAALIGLFAIPQVVEMLEIGRNKKIMTLIDTVKHSVVDSILETLSKVRALFIGSTVGVIIGLIPGAGRTDRRHCLLRPNPQIQPQPREVRLRRKRGRRCRGIGQQRHGRAVFGAAADPQRAGQSYRRRVAGRLADPWYFSGSGSLYQTRGCRVDLYRFHACRPIVDAGIRSLHCASGREDHIGAATYSRQRHSGTCGLRVFLGSALRFRRLGHADTRSRHVLPGKSLGIRRRPWCWASFLAQSQNRTTCKGGSSPRPATE